jgi:transposase
MRRKRQQYAREFKAEAIRQATTSDRSIAAVARDLGIKPALLSQWVRHVNGRTAVPGGTEVTASEAEELRRLRRENAVLREEREILKKATAFFAKEAR